MVRGLARAATDRTVQERIHLVRLVVFDFDGVFTDNMVYTFQDGNEAVCCSRADGLGLRKLERLGIEMLVLSTEVNPVVGTRCRKIGIACIQACADKRAALVALLQQKGLHPSQVAYVGNDVNDLSCLNFVGLPIVVQDAHPDIRDIAYYRTRLPGGRGAVREVCDLFETLLMRAQSAAKP